MKKQISTVDRELLGASLLLLWLPFFFLCFYAYPALDDFGESTWVDLWASQKGRYLGYTGRFIGSLMQAFNPWHWQSLSAYHISAGLRIVLFILCAHALFRAINHCRLAASHRELIILQILFSGSFLAGLSSPAEFFYWYSASVIYLVPLSVLLLSTAMLVNQFQARKRGGIYGIAYGVGFFYVSGNVEMLPLLVLSITAPTIVYAHYRSSDLVRPLCVIFAITLVGLCINLLAPGNSVRQTQMHTATRTSDLLGFMGEVLLHMANASAMWCRDAYVMLPALLSAPVFWKLGRRGLRLPNPILIAATMMYCLVVLYIGPLWGLGFTVGRVENLCLFFFLLGLYAFVASATVRVEALANAGRMVAIAGIVAASVMCLALGLVLVPGENKVFLAYRELLNGKADAYVRSEQQRAEKIKNYVSEDVVVPPLSAVAHSLAPKVISLEHGGEDVLAENPRDWWGNNALAAYYGKRSLWVQKLSLGTECPSLRCREYLGSE